jgi:hypothetical protein
MLKKWTVLYQEKPFINTLCFVCSADDTEHAEEQCLDAYPDSNVVWTFQGEPEDAYEDYWRPFGSVIEKENRK